MNLVAHFFSFDERAKSRESAPRKPIMFRDRADAGHQLAQYLKDRKFSDPLILAIPRGGIVVGDVLATELSADLDVVLSRKLRCPSQPELAVGALSEDGEVYLNESITEALQL